MTEPPVLASLLMVHRTLLPALAALLLLAPTASATTPIHTAVERGAVVWTPDAPFASATLLARGPDGLELRRAFDPGERLVLDPGDVGSPLPDGFYLYDLALVGSEDQRTSQTGSFEVRGGIAIESPAMAVFHAGSGWIDGRLCVGPMCDADPGVSETLILKESDVKILFVDSSTASGFPTNDWSIQINDTATASDHFEVMDDTNGLRPFRIEARAPNWSLFVEDTGDIGLGTDNPAVNIHAVDGDSPAVRLEQDGSSGFTPQTWDLSGNETSFNLRDVTNGSSLPFRVRPAAPSNQLVVHSVGVGVGLLTPTAKFDVDGLTLLRDRLLVGYSDVAVPPVNATLAVSGLARFGADIRVDGGGRVDGDLDVRGTFVGRGQLNFLGDYSAISAPVLRVKDQPTDTNLMILTKTGSLTIAGTLNQSSDATLKTDVVPIDPEAVLMGVASLPISTWRYIADEDGVSHLGPMAQDFYRAFGLGMGETTIATVDADGVALASIQALAARTEADRLRIEQLEADNADLGRANRDLAARLARIEALLGASHE